MFYILWRFLSCNDTSWGCCCRMTDSWLNGWPSPPCRFQSPAEGPAGDFVQDRLCVARLKENGGRATSVNAVSGEDRLIANHYIYFSSLLWSTADTLLIFLVVRELWMSCLVEKVCCQHHQSMTSWAVDGLSSDGEGSQKAEPRNLALVRRTSPSSCLHATPGHVPLANSISHDWPWSWQWWWPWAPMIYLSLQFSDQLV